MSQCLPLGAEDPDNFPAICNPGVLCFGAVAQQCSCSAVTFFLSCGCDSCFQPSVRSWDNYSETLGCTGGVPEQFPSPLPTGATTVPLWVLEMASATPVPSTFDLAAASAFVSPVPSSTIDSTSTPLTNTPLTNTPLTSIPLTSTHAITTQTELLSTHLSTSPVSLMPVSNSLASSVPSTPFSSTSLLPTNTTSSSFVIGSMVTTTTMVTVAAGSSSNRNGIPTAAIVGVVVVICAIVSLAVAILLWRHWRHRYPTMPSSIPTPFVFGDDSQTVSPVTDGRQPGQTPLVQQNHSATTEILRLSGSEGGDGAATGNMIFSQVREPKAQMHFPSSELGMLGDAPPRYSV